jgi:imidazolonepropionase
MARHGTTTVEAKTSGIGDGNLEIKLLRAMGMLRSTPIDLVPSILCRLSDEAALDRLLADTLPKIRRRKLAQFADIEWRGKALDGLARRFLGAAAELGFLCRVHADGPSPETALELAASGCIASIDHLEYADADVAAALSKSKAVVTLLPGSGFRTDSRMAPARALIDAGAAVALGSNFNPLHTPSVSMQTVVALACMRMGMTPAESISASTINSAWALGCATTAGSLEPGKSADVLILNVADYREMANHFGMNLAYLTLKRGACVYAESEIMPRIPSVRQPVWG